MTPGAAGNWRGVALLLAIAALFGSNHVAARVAFDHGTSVSTAVAVRSTGTALAVLVLVRLAGLSVSPGRATLGRALLVGLALAAQSFFLYSAVARIPVALALLTFNTFPLLLALLSWLTGGGRPAARTLVALPLSLAGLALALDVAGVTGSRAAGVSARWDEIGTGVAFALAASLSFACALLLTTRWLGALDGRVRTFLTMSVVAVVMIATGAAGGSFAWPRDLPGWTGLALLTIFYGTAITSLFVLLPRIGAVNNSAVLNFEPIVVMALAWPILGQAVAPVQVAGAFMVIGAVLLLGTARR